MEGMLLLVDTNVWMANYVPTRAGHQQARDFLAEAWQRELGLLYPAPILKDVFYLIGMEYKRQVRAEKGAVSQADAAAINELAWGCVHNMRELATAVAVDESDLWLACKYRSLSQDLEDNVVLAAARRCGARHLVTFDESLIRRSPVSALLPKDMVALLRAELGTREPSCLARWNRPLIASGTSWYALDELHGCTHAREQQSCFLSNDM